MNDKTKSQLAGSHEEARFFGLIVSERHLVGHPFLRASGLADLSPLVFDPSRIAFENQFSRIICAFEAIEA